MWLLLPLSMIVVWILDLAGKLGHSSRVPVIMAGCVVGFLHGQRVVTAIKRDIEGQARVGDRPYLVAAGLLPIFSLVLVGVTFYFYWIVDGKPEELLNRVPLSLFYSFVTLSCGILRQYFFMLFRE